MLEFENKLNQQGINIVIGVDEAGRGPLAGPVVAGAVWLKKTDFKNRIDDSKKLTAIQREKAFSEIIDSAVIGIGIINEKIIDRLNILVATQIAMEEAISSLVKKIGPLNQNAAHVLVDGPVKLKTHFEYTTLIKGDTRSLSIAAASIIAKVTRDRIMQIYDKIFPQYGFIKHKGYPTFIHRQAIKNFGSSIIHRKSFICE